MMVMVSSAQPSRKAFAVMTDRGNGIEIEHIPVDRIKVLNPRERDCKKFREVVDSIGRVGLKQPIKVTRLNGSGGDAEYGLVYGQGRLEAFIALGEKEIPAIVADLSEEDSLLMSLVENVARRHHRPTELLREIGALRERGYSDAQIARKIGFSPKYVRGIRRLLEAGEERLLAAVETGKMPLNVAIDIAAADDGHVQQVLADAYETGALSGRQLIEAKRQVDQRQRYGKAPLSIQAKRGRSREFRPGQRDRRAQSALRLAVILQTLRLRGETDIARRSPSPTADRDLGLKRGL